MGTTNRKMSAISTHFCVAAMHSSQTVPCAKNRLEKCRATDIPPIVAESIENVLRNLSAELEHLDALILTHFDQHPELKKDFDLLTSIKSVGFQLEQ